MPYALYYSNGSLFTNLNEQAFDTTSSSITLAGRGSVNYGVVMGQNLLWMLENFSSAFPPSNPLTGQLWYDSSKGLMKVYDSGTWTAFANVGGLGNTVGLPQGTSLAGAVSAGNRIAGSTGYVLLNPATLNATTVGLTISEGKIISVASGETIASGVLPSYITIQGFQFAFGTRFPQGLRAGNTLATDSATTYVNAGLATSTLLADIAERYEIETPGEPGDVVSIGGSREIRITEDSEDTDVFGVISTAPGVRMNDEVGEADSRDLTHPLIALLGRVPCKVVGPVRKGQRLVSAGISGAAKAAEGSIDPRAIIGRALEAKSSIGLSLIEVVVGRS